MHAFLWFINGDDKLSGNARNTIEDMNNKRYLSMASLWEMTIKSSIGKLKIPMPINRFCVKYIWGNGIQLLDINPHHLNQVHDLPFYHKDPFDRLMIAQAMTEDMTIISCDEYFQYYDIQVLW